ncbi:MAG: HRDC domain protein [Bacillota bacterium]|nr:MAG: HRDC domain protein [Bacillota bacterium]
MTQQELYDELIKVRNAVKRKFISGGRMPAVCSDDALKLIAAVAPKRGEDLQCISGLGKTFVEKYGAYFMEPLDRFHKENAANAKITDDVRKTLKNLESRLVNINKRNRLLYMGKIYEKYAYDLHGRQMNALLEYITGKPSGKGFLLSEIDYANDSAAKKSKFKKLLTLEREVIKDIRESGQNDLYIGWPYLCGKMAGEDFNIRAPLALFPVTLERENESVYLLADGTRDILYNNNLILTQYKFSGSKKELPASVIEEVGENFIEELCAYYREAGIRFAAQLPKPAAFAEYTEETFPKFKSGEFRLENNAVLGKFSMYSSALQRDFKAIIEKDEINKLLDSLLENSGDIDYYSDERRNDGQGAENSFTERQINYINALNASQENAVFSLGGCDELVVQGPPGTGKSQTITSLIVDYVLKGHNVLMVSQKKAALDVIYSRLGALSKYALFVSDTKDKEFFYTQLYNLLYSAQKSDFDEQAYDDAVEVIDNNILELKEIADKLYKKNGLGTEMYRLYRENADNVFLGNYLLQSVGYENEIGGELFSVSYPALQGMRDKFKDELYLGRLKEYFDLLQSYPWLKKIKPLGRLELAEPLKLCAQLIAMKREYDAKFCLVRPFYKGDIIRKIKDIMELCFKKRQSVKEFFISPAHLMDGLMSFDRFTVIRALFDTLSAEEKLYITAVNNIADKTGVSMAEANRNVYDYIVLRHIDAFEASNKPVLSYIQNYDLIVDAVESNIEKKKKLTMEKLKQQLSSVYTKNIASSKRFGEMKRAVEGKRKQSVPKFIDRFAFELFRGVKIWLMTPEVVSESLPLDNGLFDLVVFDEASQLYVEKGVPAVQRAKKVVIAGDHKQLRPSSLGFGRLETDAEFDDDAEINAALEEESLLDLARFKYNEVLLNFHYRSKYEELIAFSNYAFYHGRLMISPNTEQPARPPIEVVRVKNGTWRDRRNEPEAKTVVTLLKSYLKTRTAEQSVGVITFNSAQKDAIMDAIDEECAKDRDFALRCSKEWNRKRNGEDIGLFVKNIENVQGDERDCIIFSLAYAKNEQGKVVRNFGWLNQRGGENRLNVAISRAKEKIYVVSSIASSELYVGDLQTEGPKIFKKYLEYAEAVSAGKKELAHQVLLSFTADAGEAAATDVSSDFSGAIRDALVKCGYEVEENVGIGGYSIDLAVKSQGRYVLGIECDARLYALSDSVRDRDVHRQEYLESRGWRLHRVWSTDWWHSPEKEIEKIQKIVGTLS